MAQVVNPEGYRKQMDEMYGKFAVDIATRILAAERAFSARWGFNLTKLRSGDNGKNK